MINEPSVVIATSIHQAWLKEVMRLNPPDLATASVTHTFANPFLAGCHYESPLIKHNKDNTKTILRQKVKS
jgi:hypothetical protein